MSPETIGIIGIIIMLAFMFLQMPLGAVMAVVGFAGICFISGGIAQGSSVLALSPYRTATTYMLTVIPLFVLMGIFAAYAGISEDSFYAVNKWLGHLRGGLAMATVGACAAFAAVCGAAIATAATMCKAALPEMRRYGYADQLSLGTIASGGMLGFMIPPSIPFILYAYLTQESIGSLFLAGIFPGILISVLFIVAVYIICLRNPKMGASGPKASWRERVISLYHIWSVIILFVLVLGGMYGGIFTPTEGGAVGAFGALILGLVKRKITRKNFVLSLTETAQITGMIFLIIIGANIFNHFITISQIPFAVVNTVGALNLPPLVLMIAILVIYVIIGFFMDIMAIMFITVPILYPLLLNAGIDPVWFGVLVVLTIMIGNVTPPVGVVVFAVGGIVKDVPLFTIFRGVWPFVWVMLFSMVILIIFPQISLWLPSMMSPVK